MKHRAGLIGPTLVENQSFNIHFTQQTTILTPASMYVPSLWP